MQRSRSRGSECEATREPEGPHTRKQTDRVRSMRPNSDGGVDRGGQKPSRDRLTRALRAGATPCPTPRRELLAQLRPPPPKSDDARPGLVLPDGDGQDA
jgi:hypothetical protein